MHPIITTNLPSAIRVLKFQVNYCQTLWLAVSVGYVFIRAQPGRESCCAATTYPQDPVNQSGTYRLQTSGSKCPIESGGQKNATWREKEKSSV